MFDSLSALQDLPMTEGRDGADGRRQLRLGELRGGHLAQLGVFPGGADAVAAATRGALGAAPPLSPNEAAAHGALRMMRIASDQYWILAPQPDPLRALRSALPADAGSLLCLAGARTRLLIEGTAAARLLERLVPIDLDPGSFPVGRFAQTGLHHVGGLLYHAAPGRYEFFALRTFAACTFEVLADAARPFGYDFTFTDA
ncbi:MAG: hypothetical protein KGL34_03460 [Gammaproteobacteria bacterium]|nr:hypothetical protein [Gammaproteobacteria bacterium]